MGERAGQGFGRCEVPFSHVVDSRCSRELPQDRIHEWGSRAFAGAFHQFDAFVESRARRDAIEPEELINGQPQSYEDFQVKLG